MIDYALRLYDQGIITVPVGLDKKTSVAWGEWYKVTPDRAVFEEAWRKRVSTGLAVLCGQIELLEADVKNDPKHNIHERLMQAIKDNLDEATYERLYIQKSPSGGFHFWYKVLPGEEHGNYPDLARIEYTDVDRFELNLPDNASNIGVIVETRGRGGYALIAPSPKYEVLQGSIEDLPTLTNEEHELMIMIGRSFNEFEPLEIPVTPTSSVPNQSSGSGKRPGDIYNDRTSAYDLVNLLERYGFTRMRELGGNMFLKRPGQDRPGHAAKVNLKLNCFVNYSSSVGQFVPMKGYSPYYVYAYLQHNGDFAAATRDLAAKGFEDPDNRKPSVALQREAMGASLPAFADPFAEDPFAHATEEDFLAGLEQYRFSLANRPKIHYNLFFTVYGKMQGVAFPGALIAVYGQAKSRKTTFLGAVIAAALSGKKTMNITFNEPGKVLWVDTEQGSMHFWETMWRVAVQAGMKEDDKEKFFSYSLVDMAPSDRQKVVAKMVETIQPKILVLDGIVDFMYSMNDEKEAMAVIGWMRKFNAMGITVFTVLHLNPGKENDVKARGHIGTFLTNKCDTAIVARADKDDETRVSIVNTWSRGPKFPAFDLTAGTDGILYDGGKPPYDFTIGKPERIKKEEAVADPEPAPAAAEIAPPEMDVFQLNRANFADEEVLF